LHNEEFQSSCFSLNIIIVIISSRIRWAGDVARMREVRRDHLEDSGIDGRIILECILVE